jgi:hypothetical protein
MNVAALGANQIFSHLTGPKLCRGEDLLFFAYQPTGAAYQLQEQAALAVDPANKCE